MANAIKRPGNLYDRYLHFGVGVKVVSNGLNYEVPPIYSRITSDAYENVWHNFMINYKNGYLYAYIDGELMDSIKQDVKTYGNRGAIGRHWWFRGGSSSARFIGIVDDVRIYNRALSECEILAINGIDCDPIDPCNDEIAFGDRLNANAYKMVQNANYYDSTIKVTHNEPLQRGAFWTNYKYDISEDFEVDFTLILSEGNNNNNDDGSIPGADGVAFVIQNHDKNAVGSFGGGIGYHKIPNSFAIEIDLFQNQEQDIDDPNGYHIAAFSKGVDTNSSKHSDLDALISYEPLPFDLMVDDTEYRFKIIYNSSLNTISVRMELNGVYQEILALNDIDFEELLNLDFGKYAYFGMTSATGSAYQKHEITDFSICSEAEVLSIYTTDNRDIQFKIIKNELIIQNPADEQVRSVRLININGRESFISSYSKFNDEINVYLGKYSPGVKILVIETDKRVIEKKIMIVR